MIILEDETLDDLQLRGLKLIQKKNGFKLCLDSVLLSDFAIIHPSAHVVDLGTGSGVIPLLLWGRDKGKYFYGIEIQKTYAEMAKRTVQLNHLDKQIQILCCDVLDSHYYLQPNSIDAVVCNPPYPYDKANTATMLYSSEEISRHQSPECLQHFLSAAHILLKGKGKFFVVYPASEMLEIMQALRLNHLEPKRFRLVYPFIDKPAKLVLIEAVNGGRPTLHPMPPLIIHSENGNLTNELKSIYHIKE